MSYLSRKEIDDLKSPIDKLVYRVVGSSDTSVLRTAIDCLSKGYDRRKITDKLSSYIDSKKATRLAEKLVDLIEDFRTSHQSKKRTHEDDREKDGKRSKSSRFDVKESDKNSKTEKVDKKISDSSVCKNNVSIANLNIPPPSIYGIPMGLLNRGDADKARKIAQLQAQIKSKLSTGILGNAIQIPIPSNKPTPLILDEDGRTIDKTGKAVQLTHVTPTLKANMRAMKRDQFKGTTGDKHHDESSETRFIDPRIGVKPPVRTRKALRFHEPGKFQQLAERLRMKVSFLKTCLSVITYLCFQAQLEKLQNEISQIAKKTGISSATKLALIAKSEGHSEDIPNMEWWDSVILVDNLDTIVDGNIAIKDSAINTLVEHPTQMRCPSK